MIALAPIEISSADEGSGTTIPSRNHKSGIFTDFSG